MAPHTSPSRFVPDTAGEVCALATGAQALGVKLDDDQCGRLLEFARLLEHWNRAFNLISRRDVDRLLPRHLLDSLSGAALLDGTEIMDLGTGAGLPGVPLAIARADLHFTLVDRSERKIRFVRQAVRSLALNNVSTWCGDAQALPEEARFDSVICRAVAGLDACWALARARLGPGGRLVIMHRGQHPAAEQAQPLALPADARLLERRLVEIAGLEHPHELVVLTHAAA
ncbi:MAG: 16S rRNA (guanine(527)-N(7))-methyltransferase RsmG [Gammaproteobacteria bacterium]|nr:16S rRNA (guanine(527)-N(7))-methyltransferase RsmG [Gammaproteobacteria bacterium]